MFGYLWSELQFGPVRSAPDRSFLGDRIGPNRNYARKYPNMTGKILYDPTFCVDSEYVVRFVRAGYLQSRVTSRNVISGQAHQVDNPGPPDRADPIAELGTKI